MDESEPSLCSRETEEVALSREYTPDKIKTRVEHSAYMPHGEHNWEIKLKGRRKNSSEWHDIQDICRNPQVTVKNNDVYLELEGGRSDLEVAAFGIAGEGDCKRLQMAVFGKKTSHGRPVHVTVYLIEDTIRSFKETCGREKKKGNKLLAPMSSVLLSAGGADVVLTLSNVSQGWTHGGEDTKTISFSRAWNSLASPVPPHCSFVLKQTDVNQGAWACHVSLQHNTENARVDVCGRVKETLQFQQCRSKDDSFHRKQPKMDEVYLTKAEPVGSALPRRKSDVSPRGLTTALLALFLSAFLFGLTGEAKHDRTERGIGDVHIQRITCKIKRRARTKYDSCDDITLNGGKAISEHQRCQNRLLGGVRVVLPSSASSRLQP